MPVRTGPAPSYAHQVTPQEHWQHLYATRPADTVGWYEAVPITSRKLVAEAVASGARSVIDVGGGASFLVDYLIQLDLDRVAVLDISGAGLEVARQRLGARGRRVEWIVADVTGIADIGRFDVWHDRAVFHFLTEEDDRKRYLKLAERTVQPGGTAIIATFAPDGPERCSGLPVCRYDAGSLADACGPSFRLDRSLRHEHVTPRGVPQRFMYASLARVSEPSASVTVPRGR